MEDGKTFSQTKTESIMGKCWHRVSDVTAVWAGEMRSSSSVGREWRLYAHMHPLDGFSSSISSKSMVCAAPCWADGGTSSWNLKVNRLLRVPAEAPLCPNYVSVCGPRLLLRSDLHTGQRRRSGRPRRGAVSLQEGFDGERTAELHLTSDLNSFAGCSFRRVESWRPAPVLCFQFGGQLREEMQDSFKVTTHHLYCDLTGVQFPVVPLTVQWVWGHWNLKTQHNWVKTSYRQRTCVPLKM